MIWQSYKGTWERSTKWGGGGRWGWKNRLSSSFLTFGGNVMVCLCSHLKSIVVWHGQRVYQVNGVGSVAMGKGFGFLLASLNNWIRHPWNFLTSELWANSVCIRSILFQKYLWTDMSLTFLNIRFPNVFQKWTNELEASRMDSLVALPLWQLK